jgi:mycothiol synthase
MTPAALCHPGTQDIALVIQDRTFDHNSPATLRTRTRPSSGYVYRHQMTRMKALGSARDAQVDNNQAEEEAVLTLDVWALSQIHSPRPEFANQAEIQAVWSDSQDRDEPAGRPHDGWWSIANWATASRLLMHDDEVIGFAAIEYQPGADTAEGRLGLLPGQRRPGLAERLIHMAVDLAQEAGAPHLRLYIPEAATWASAAALNWGFHPLRAQHLMLRPTVPPLPVSLVPGLHIRPLHRGEDAALLAALNRAWATTWNFRPITAAALAADLHEQRDGMLVAIADGDEKHIAGAVHAMFDPSHHNPDGSPYAWISNLTTDPAWRGRGLGRALLAAGLMYLYERGARSVALGVDGGNTAAVQLYHSMGFTPISTVGIWERAIDNRELKEAFETALTG